MDAPLTLDHSGLRCTLRSGPSRAILWVWGFLLLIPIGLFSAVSISIAALHLLWFTSLYGALVMGGLALWGSARTELRCDGRTLEWQRSWGPFRMAKQRVSLLDLKSIGAADGKLLIEPRPGPVLPVALAARGLAPEALAQLAHHLHEAIAQAERFRGDAPDQRTRAVIALAQREPGA